MVLNKNMFLKPKNELEGRADKRRVETVTCGECGYRFKKSELKNNLYTCERCGEHFKMPARTRLNMIADEGTFIEHDASLVSTNILDFPGYGEKLEGLRKKSGENESVITGTLSFRGIKCAVFAMESEFMMGSMGRVTGEKVTRLFEYAAKEGLPVVGYCLSGGARVQEGILSLMQMAKTSGAVKLHSDKGLLYIAVLQNPTTGGVTASFAMEADIILAEPNALIGFAGPRVIEQTMRQKLPKGFQRAEFVKQKGFIDRVVPRKDQMDVIEKLLKMHLGEGF